MHRSILATLAMTFVSLLLSGETVHAETGTITTAFGVGADSYVQHYASTPHLDNRNFGGRGAIELRNVGTGTSAVFRKSYIRFDISEIPDIDMTSVSLELIPYSTSSSGNIFNVYGLNDGHDGEDWLEGDYNNIDVTLDGNSATDDWITWGNAPANDVDNTVNPLETTLLGSFEGGQAPTPVGITGSVLCDFINADTNGMVTLIITRETHDPNAAGPSHLFTSKEFYGGPPFPTLLYEFPDPIPGDANYDGSVNHVDAGILAANWLSSTDVAWNTGDFNGDGVVDEIDATLLATNWQTAESSTVPEPSTFALLGAILTVFFLWRNKRHL